MWMGGNTSADRARKGKVGFAFARKGGLETDPDEPFSSQSGTSSQISSQNERLVPFGTNPARIEVVGEELLAGVWLAIEREASKVVELVAGFALSGQKRTLLQADTSMDVAAGAREWGESARSFREEQISTRRSSFFLTLRDGTEERTSFLPP